MSLHINILLKLLLITLLLPACSGSAKQTAQQGTDNAPLRLADFSADSAYALVKQQLDFGPRIPGTTSHRKCADYLTQRLAALNPDTIITQSTPLPLRNILAQFNSSAPTRILLAAHYDTRPWADNDPDPARRNLPVPGANDGASGVAVLLEVARLISQQTPHVAVDILLLDAEDSGHDNDELSWARGAQHFAQNLPYTSSTIPSYAILLDMVADHNARFGRELYSEHYARPLNDHIQSIASLSGFQNHFTNQPTSAITDDHIFLNQAGIPTADIIDCSNAATNQFPASWHTTTDDITNISPLTLHAVGQTITNIIYSQR